MNRRGFTFIELIVGLAIMIMIATAVTPVVLDSLDDARVSTAVSSLTALSDALDAFEEDVKEHPGALRQLAEPIEASQLNVCDLEYRSGPGKGGTEEWEGPYLDRSVPATGLPVGVGTALDEITRAGDRTRGGYMIVTIVEVSPDDAVALDGELDGGDGGSGGAIRWAAMGSGSMTIEYYKPSPRC